MPDFASAVESVNGRLVQLRHELHAHPEPGYQEHWTASRLLAELHSIPGLVIRSGLAGTGIVATLNADKPGPCVALRADMDALLLEERNCGLPYASTQPGRMHACGHDGHMACLVGAALVLAPSAGELPGKVKFIFQPAEEDGGGGRRLVEEEGVLDDPKVDAAFALHGWPHARIGRIEVGQGPVMAATTAFEVTINGTGTHAAFPHLGTDVVVAAAQVITALQTISSRWDPVDPVVVSVCNVEAGHTYNVLPESCRMKGTIRGLRRESHQRVWEMVRKIITETAGVFGCTASVDPVPGYPALVNHPECAGIVAEAAAALYGSNAVNTNPPPVMGGEDFAFYAQAVPSALFYLGVCGADQESCPSLHSPQFDFADEAIPIGVATFCEIVARCLADPPSGLCG